MLLANEPLHCSSPTGYFQHTRYITPEIASVFEKKASKDALVFFEESRVRSGIKVKKREKLKFQ